MDSDDKSVFKVPPKKKKNISTVTTFRFSHGCHGRKDPVLPNSFKSINKRIIVAAK